MWLVWRAGGRAAEQYRSLSRDARLYLLAEALAAVATGGFATVYALYVAGLGYDASFLGAVLVAAMAGAGLGVLPAGRWVDLAGPRRVLLASSLIVAAGLGAELVSGARPVLLAGNAVAGAGAAAFFVAAAPFLIEIAPPGQQAGLFSLDAAVTQGGSAIGAAAAGQIAAILSRPAGGSGLLAAPSPADPFRFALLGAGVVGACSFVPLALTHDPRRSHATARSDGPLVEADRPASLVASGGWRDALACADAVRLATTAGLVGLGGGFFIPYLNVFLVDGLGASVAAYGWLNAAGTVAGVVATLLAPSAGRRFGAARAVGWAHLAAVVPLLALGFAPHFAMASAAFLVRGALLNLVLPLQTNFTMERLPAGLRGAGNSLIWLAANLTRAAGTLLGGLLVDAVGYRLPYVLTAALYVLAAALFLQWFARPSRGRPVGR